MPQPSLHPVNVRALIERVAALETRVKVQVAGGPEMTIPVDPDQVEQMMINLIKNAADAALETVGLHRDNGTSPDVSIDWSYSESLLRIQIRDRGPGLMNPD